jgi:hypothetical protein
VALAQSEQEFTCQIFEADSGRGVIIPNYEYLTIDFWENTIDHSKTRTVDECIEVLNRYGFVVKTENTAHGRRFIIMSKRDDKRASKSNFDALLKFGEETEHKYSKQDGN